MMVRSVINSPLLLQIQVCLCHSFSKTEPLFVDIFLSGPVWWEMEILLALSLRITKYNFWCLVTQSFCLSFLPDKFNRMGASPAPTVAIRIIVVITLVGDMVP